MSTRKALDDLSESIKALFKKDVTIVKIRFPNYRNLKENSELPLDFPITVLLGRNGTNKSSILHALYGSVRDKSVGDFWFETKLDAIPEERNGLKQSVVHTYRNADGDLVECIKNRAPRIKKGDKDPDYWESVKHTYKYGMTCSGERTSPVVMPVMHLDFRGELTAFDKYFYFPDPKHLEKRIKSAKKADSLRRKYRKQDYLRYKSHFLKKEIAEKGVEFTEEELNTLRYILGRNYLSGKVLRHSLFHGHEGYTILFGTSNIEGYSDAFAGSGESAAALLVHKICQSAPNSLILLDEPETSLHPDAQRKMMQFIAHQAVRKSLQVVIATHSIYLAKDLPQEAIRVLSLNDEETVSILTNVSASEALHEIETIPAGKTIIVEDERAKRIVLSALKLTSGYASKEFQVIVRPGGVPKIYPDIRAYVNSDRKDISIIFDGDQKPRLPYPKDSELLQDKDELEKLIKEFIRGNNKKGQELNLGTPDEKTKYIRFLRDFVDYIPERTPEQFVWDDLAAKEIFEDDLPNEIINQGNYKERIDKFAELQGVSPDTVFEMLLRKVLKGDSERKRELMEIINRVRSR
jgi:predicted ATPase